jgi:flagellar protein FlaG
MSDLITQTGREALSLSQVKAAPRVTNEISATTSAQSAATPLERGKALPPQSTIGVTEAVEKLNTYVQSIERTLDFQLDEDSGKTIIRVYDKESEELIRQIPGELAVELAQKLNEEEPLLLFSAQV